MALLGEKRVDKGELEVKMSGDEKIFAFMLAIIIILSATLAVVAATYPQTPEELAITYRGWTIYQPDQNATRTNYVAVHSGFSPLSNGDLPDLIGDIDEAMR
jgi:hypothetical protein